MLSLLKKIIDIGKKVFLVIAVYFIVVNLFLYFINKDKRANLITEDPIIKNRVEIYKIINDPKLNATKQGKTTIAVYRIMTCKMIGEACSNNPQDGDKDYGKSVFGFMTNLIALPYANPPASFTMWAYDGLQSAGFVPKSMAAEGVGFAAIKPLMNLWKVFRDISYMLLVLVLIAIGFMIMFRMKLNPQTIISVENALPKIIIALILITFSFAIAGFLIDLMYILIAIIISLISNNNAFYNAADFQQAYMIAGAERLWPYHLDFLKIGTSIMGLLPLWINHVIRVIALGLGIYFVYKPLTEMILNVGKSSFNNISILGTTLGEFPGTITGAVISLVILGIIVPLLVIYGGGIILMVFAFLTVILLFFRLFLMLFKSYLQILLMVIFAPILLLFEAMPGKSAFSWWFKNIFAEILTFPMVIALLLISYVLTNTITASGTLWSPPFLFGINPEAYSMLVGAGIIYLAPELVKIAKELMGVKPLPVSIGPGTFLGSAGVALAGVQKGAGTFSSLTQMPGIGNWLLAKAQEQRKSGGGLLSNLIPPSVGEQVARAMREEKK